MDFDKLKGFGLLTAVSVAYKTIVEKGVVLLVRYKQGSDTNGLDFHMDWDDSRYDEVIKAVKNIKSTRNNPKKES